MDYQLQHLVIISIIAFVLGCIISYLIVKAFRVSRSEFDKLKEQLGATQNSLDTQLALVNKISEDKEQLGLAFNAEQDMNRQQERKISELVAKNDSMIENYTTEKELNQKQQAELTDHQSQILSLNKQVATFGANNKALMDKLDSQKDEIVAIRKESELQFEKIANRLLEEKSEKFSKTNRDNMVSILSPLQEKIKSFEKKVEDSTKESVDRHSSLKEMIKNVSEQSQRVAYDANNLTKALKGDYKQQGNWGEVILQSVLDKSGLEKDREYFIQQTLTSDEGTRQRPDVIIELPEEKRLIIDSKVSLVAYDAMVGADALEEAEKHQKNHAIAIKNHINNLADKNYHDLYKVESPDFVIMFIPIDTAFSSALKSDSTLYNYAFSKNVIIVTASTLLATLKTVESLWKNDKQNRYALEIASEAGKMYDKFVGFAEDMEKIGNQLNTVQKTYSGSMKKLTEGSGNLVRRAERIKELGASANKRIPTPLLKKIS